MTPRVTRRTTALPPPTHEQDLARLRRPTNRQKLVQLLAGYEILRDLAWKFFEGMPNPPKEMNIAYMRLIPRLDELAKELLLRPEDNSTIKLERYCIPSRNLYLIKEEFKNATPKRVFDKSDVMDEMGYTYGKIKQLVINTGAETTHAPEDLDEHMKEADAVLHGTARETQQVKIPLAGKRISFDRGLSVIMVDDKPCHIDRASIQSRVVQAMFSQGSVVGRSVHWHNMLGTPLSDTALRRDKQNKSISDAVRGINEKIHTITDDDLFEWDTHGNLVRRF
jgi:hypothetical protein